MDSDVEFDTSDLRTKIRSYENRLKNLPMEVYSALLLGYVDEMFETQGASGVDGPWEPLKESTLKRHPRRRGGQILQDTGATAGEQDQRIVGQQITMRPTTAYGGWHIEGTTKMVRRDYYAINFPKFLSELDELVLVDLG